MTENEALYILNNYNFNMRQNGAFDMITAISVVTNALKEIQQYREIGTVEECRKAVKKQKAKKIVYESDSVFCDGFTHYRMGKCPVCDRYYNSSDEVNYCSKCGQALMNENLEGMEDE